MYKIDIIHFILTMFFMDFVYNYYGSYLFLLKRKKYEISRFFK